MNTKAIINIINNLDSTSVTDALSANMGRELNNSKQDKVEDTGWIDLPLSNGVLAYDVTVKPQYRKIGNIVHLRGAAKNVLANFTVIGILPEGYRPLNYSHNYLQITSNNNGSSNFSRMKVGTNGEVMVETISSGITAVYGANVWFPISTSFLID